MKKYAILFIMVLVLLGALTSVQASYIGRDQQTPFIYFGNPYWAFIYDYTEKETEAATDGFQAVDTVLDWYAQYSGVIGNRITHVAYIYSSSLGAFYAAQSAQSWKL